MEGKMISIQAVPKSDVDVYKLLRDKVTHKAHTFEWANKAKTRLHHKGSKSGYIKVGTVEGVLVAQIKPQESAHYFLCEKFIGRLIAWFENELMAINIQLKEETEKKKKRKR